ncbi:ATP-dependent nuclease [Nocardioides nematodiphilus]|uniref:ATP-dependent nuclease n=1 Tax=Nocardioides nematodiphilus TaxID=2849669 RepID=UPI001CD951D4|nr:AAA family ATPase [Nocardioides nematodiphilus]MCA1983740.1 AAA family ATPase [Nocardioides nematodiphilus]
MTSRESPTLPGLASDWASSRNTSAGWPLFLEAVYIDGVRGWQKQWVEFRFPVVAIAGENGSGKSTVLKAAAAAYRPAAGDAAKDLSPDDFFPSTPWEIVSGVRLEYRIRQGDSVEQKSLRKQTTRWRGMPERLARNVVFLDISRTQPVDTLIGYGRVARTELAKSATELQLTPDNVKVLSRVLGRNYESGSIVRDERGKQVGIVETSSGASYSNFHQGAGEDATTDLIALLQEAPRNSLILIDEVEASLHPRAQRRLMTELIGIARARRLQLVVSTHSPYVLEQLPPEARIYLRSTRAGQREPVYGVTPEYALSLMDDERHPELLAYCEDGESGSMVESIVRRFDPGALERMKIVEVGPAGTVRSLGGLAHAGKLPEAGIGVLDGDEGSGVGCVALPGGGPPEVVVYRSMSEDNMAAVAERLGVRFGDLADIVDDALTIPNHHAWSAEIARQLGDRVRKSRVWESFLDVWVTDVLDESDGLALVERFKDLLPTMGLGDLAQEVEEECRFRRRRTVDAMS